MKIIECNGEIVDETYWKKFLCFSFAEFNCLESVDHVYMLCIIIYIKYFFFLFPIINTFLIFLDFSFFALNLIGLMKCFFVFKTKWNKSEKLFQSNCNCIDLSSNIYTSIKKKEKKKEEIVSSVEFPSIAAYLT